MILISTIIYQKEREEEILYCLKKNVLIKIVEKYIIFFEKKDNDDNFLEKIKNIKKVEVVIINHRPMVKFMIEYMNNSIYKNKLCGITNSDILFNNTLDILNCVNFDECYIALTRYNIVKYTNFNYHGIVKKYNFNNKEIAIKTMHNTGCSTDSWFFKLPLKIDNIDLNFPLGTYNCDTYLNYQLTKNKKVFNPVKSVISLHLHKQWDHNNYDEKNHGSRTFWKNKYDVGAVGSIKFCQLKECILI